MSNDTLRINYICIGGPWDRQIVMLGSAGTLPFVIQTPDKKVWNGCYARHDNPNHRAGVCESGGKKYPMVVWKPTHSGEWFN